MTRGTVAYLFSPRGVLWNAGLAGRCIVVGFAASCTSLRERVSFTVGWFVVFMFMLGRAEYVVGRPRGCGRPRRRAAQLSRPAMTCGDVTCLRLRTRGTRLVQAVTGVSDGRVVSGIGRGLRSMLNLSGGERARPRYGGCVLTGVGRTFYRRREMEAKRDGSEPTRRLLTRLVERERNGS